MNKKYTYYIVMLLTATEHYIQAIFAPFYM